MGKKEEKELVWRVEKKDCNHIDSSNSVNCCFCDLLLLDWR
jgi:hypothetical protein